MRLGHPPPVCLPLALAALLAACRYGYDPIAIVIDDDGGAPADAALAADAEVAVDADVAPDAAPPDATCDPSAPLADDFAIQDPRWNDFGGAGAAAALVNGRLRVTLTPSFETQVYGGFITAGTYDLIGRGVSIAVPTMVATSGHAQALLQLKHDEGSVTNQAGFEQQNGTLRMFTSGVPSPVQTSIPYSPIQHRFWQIRESAGAIFFETSPDGAAWTPRFSTPASFDLSQVRIALTAGRFQPESALGFAEFDDLGGTVLLGTACKR